MNDPIADELRSQAFKEAMQDTGRYVEARWAGLSQQMRDGQEVALLEFDRMSDAVKLYTLMLLYQRATVLALDRAEQIARARTFTSEEVTPPAA